MKNFQDFVATIQNFLSSRGGQIAIAFIIYMTSVGLIEKGPGDIGEKIAFMAIGSILQSMVSNPDKKD